MNSAGFYLALSSNRTTNNIQPMKLTVLSTLVFFVALLSGNTSSAQISIVSSKGYTVNVNIQPEAIVPSTTKNCQWGYNYNIKFSYAVTVTGKNKPKSFYTLQGTINSKNATHFFQIPTKEGNGTATTRSNVWRSVSDCAVATVTTMNLSTISIEIAADGISSQTVSYPLVVALPVKLVNFSADLQHSSVKLKWATATEINNDFFTVERSTDNNQWSAIGRVKGAGNSNSLVSYESVDNAPAAGTAYYRLAQTDIDGTVSYSAIKIVNNDAKKGSISIFPVPSVGRTINLSGITDYQNHDLTLLNAGGNILFSTTLSKASVELPSLATGVYFVRVKNKVTGEATNLRYIKI